jgi:hypothetical protein
MRELYHVTLFWYTYTLHFPSEIHVSYRSLNKYIRAFSFNAVPVPVRTKLFILRTNSSRGKMTIPSISLNSSEYR